MEWKKLIDQLIGGPNFYVKVLLWINFYYAKLKIRTFCYIKFLRGLNGRAFKTLIHLIPIFHTNLICRNTIASRTLQRNLEDCNWFSYDGYFEISYCVESGHKSDAIQSIFVSINLWVKIISNTKSHSYISEVATCRLKKNYVGFKLIEKIILNRSV